MKKGKLNYIILLVSLFFFQSVYSQKMDTNFSVSDNGLIIWQKIFETSKGYNEIISDLASLGIFSDIVKNDSIFVASFNGIKPDFKGYGMSEFLTPMYIARSYINGGIRIDFKEGRYRVTLQNLTLEQAYTDPLVKQGEKTKLEFYASSKNRLKNSFLKSPAGILNYTFINLFSLKQSVNDNW